MNDATKVAVLEERIKCLETLVRDQLAEAEVRRKELREQWEWSHKEIAVWRDKIDRWRWVSIGTGGVAIISFLRTVLR